jgi:hypothetical protein
MSAFSAAASDEDCDEIARLRAENDELRQALLNTHKTLEMTATSGAFYARTAECLRETVIRWANRAEQAEDMLEAIGAGGVGSLATRPDHSPDAGNMAPPVMTPIAQRKLDSLLGEGWAISGYSICKLSPSSEMRHGFVTAGGLVGWWAQPHPMHHFEQSLDMVPPAVKESLTAHQPLTDQAIRQLYETPEIGGSQFDWPSDMAIAIARAVEAAHGIKEGA